MGTGRMIKAIVTGHSRGLGAALAAALLARGVRVLGVSRSPSVQLAAHYPQLLQQQTLDLADTAALTAWLQSGVLADFVVGSDTALLVNNAGLLAPVGAPGTQGAAAIARVVALNVTAPLILSDAFVAASQNVRDRRVAHIASGAGRNPYAGWSVYGASKAALDVHARAVACDRVPGLRIASIAPGVVDTAMQAEVRTLAAADFPAVDRFVALKQDGRLTSADDAARRLLAYLLADDFGQDAVADLRALAR